jgi:hypothetical protein
MKTVSLRILSSMRSVLMHEHNELAWYGLFCQSYMKVMLVDRLGPRDF